MIGFLLVLKMRLSKDHLTGAVVDGDFDHFGEILTEWISLINLVVYITNCIQSEEDGSLNGFKVENCLRIPMMPIEQLCLITMLYS